MFKKYNSVVSKINLLINHSKLEHLIKKDDACSELLNSLDTSNMQQQNLNATNIVMKFNIKHNLNFFFPFCHYKIFSFNMVFLKLIV
jgi:hypothetical protein